MALDERFIPLTSLNEYFVDKDTGAPLAAGTIESFRDNSRNTPKALFQLTGTPPNYTYTELDNPIVLSASGTVLNGAGDNVIAYAFPFDAQGDIDLYFLRAESSGSIEQWTREAIPNLTAGNDPTSEEFPVTNQIANPQFSRTFINKGLANTYSVTAASDSEFIVAPDWFLVLTGTGTVDIEVIPITGNDKIITSPPFVLDISVSAGISKCHLIQRMNVNSGLWASTPTQDIFLTGAFVARNETAGFGGLQMFYEESTGGAPVSIVDAQLSDIGYLYFTGTTANPIPQSTNTDLGEDGFINIFLSLQASQHISVSSVQVVPTTTEAGGDLIVYDHQSSNREQALMGDFFIPALERKHSPSLLVGWDFPVNPSQFGDNGSITDTPAYIWDQTIASTVVGGATVAFSRSPITFSLDFLTSGASGSFYVLQYLEFPDAEKFIGTSLSVNINAWQTTDDDVTVRVYLFHSGNVVLPILPDSIGTVASDGVFTLTAAGWEEINRQGLDTATTQIKSAPTLDLINEDTDYGFTGWELTSTADISTAEKVAIVVTFSTPAAATQISLNSVSVIPGDLPCRPAPRTSVAVLEDCQHYFEKSYNTLIVQDTISTSSLLVRQQGLTDLPPNVSGFARTFGFPFQTNKRTASPIITIFTPTAAGTGGDTIHFVIRNAGLEVAATDLTVSTFWTEVFLGNKAVTYEMTDPSLALSFSAVDVQAEALIQFHYVVDARLGII